MLQSPTQVNGLYINYYSSRDVTDLGNITEKAYIKITISTSPEAGLTNMKYLQRSKPSCKHINQFNPTDVLHFLFFLSIRIRESEGRLAVWPRRLTFNHNNIFVNRKKKQAHFIIPTTTILRNISQFSTWASARVFEHQTWLPKQYTNPIAWCHVTTPLANNLLRLYHKNYFIWHYYVHSVANNDYRKLIMQSTPFGKPTGNGHMQKILESIEVLQINI